MSIAEKVLNILEKNKGEYVSGSEIASSMSVTRNAVWKGVKALQEKGYVINAVTNKGYMLSDESDIMSANTIERYIECPGITVEYFDSITSTNTVLKERAENGAPEGLLLVSSEQTAGRGRRGRSFVSESGSGIYFSLLLRPTFSPSDALFITTCAAVSVAKAIEKNTNCDMKIKWVNDIYKDDKKVCGILTEASLDIEGGGLAYAVLGIGINIYFPKDNIPEELREIAGGISDVPFGSDAEGRIVADIVNFFMNEYKCLTEKRFLHDYRKRSYLDGKRITVIKPDCNREATAVEIDDNFRLLVRYNDGKKELLSSGEVSTKLKCD